MGLGITLPEVGEQGWGPVLNEAVQTIDEHLWTRETLVHTTASLANGAQELTTVALGLGCEVFRIDVNKGARVRMYATTEGRDDDASRARGELPDTETSDVGLMLDLALQSAGGRTFGPSVAVNSRESTPVVPITIDNLSGSTGTVQVIITYRRTE